MRVPFLDRHATHPGRVASPWLRGIVGLAALAASVLLVLRVADASGEAARLVVLIGSWALVLQAMAALRWPAAAGPAAALFGLLAALALFPAANRGLAVEMVVELLLATELAGWAGRLRSVVPETSASIRRQLGELGAVVAAGGLVCAAMLGATRSGVGGLNGRIALAVGLVAALVPVGLLASRRWRAG